MRIKFVKSITLIDGNGVYYEFKQGKTYELNQYWALCFIRDGYAVKRIKLEAKI